MPDQARLVVSRRRWKEVVSQYSTTSQLPNRPSEGDLIYIGGDINDILQIKFVENEEQFYQLGKIYTYELKCEKFVYTHNVIHTSNPDIDSGYLVSEDLIATLESLPTMEEMQNYREDLGEIGADRDYPFAKNFDIEKRADSVLATDEDNVFGKVGGKSPGKRRKII
jgi:F0F1-type ATP synthase gamma subunit